MDKVERVVDDFQEYSDCMVLRCFWGKGFILLKDDC